MHDFAGHEHEHLHENITAFDSKAEKAEPVPIIADNIKNYKSSYLLAVWLAPFKCSNFFL